MHCNITTNYFDSPGKNPFDSTDLFVVIVHQQKALLEDFLSPDDGARAGVDRLEPPRDLVADHRLPKGFQPFHSLAGVTT